MGVYIKGMKMPETKYECDFWNTDHICTANPKATVCDPANGIYPPEDCPLVEIPEPHGRLVDYETIDVDYWEDADGYHISVEAETVIEAEE